MLKYDEMSRRMSSVSRASRSVSAGASGWSQGYKCVSLHLLAFWLIFYLPLVAGTRCRAKYQCQVRRALAQEYDVPESCFHLGESLW
jgi:hypothetical protein